MLEEKVLTIIKQNIKVDEERNLNSTDLIEEVGINSIVFIKIIIALETEFDVEFDDDSLLYPNGETLSYFVSIVEKNIS